MRAIFRVTCSRSIRIPARATDIGSLGIANTNCESGAGIVGDITFRADGTLFGAGPCGPGVKGNLYTINLTTGTASFVGAVNSPANHRQGFGLSFLPLTSTPQKLSNGWPMSES